MASSKKPMRNRLVASASMGAALVATTYSDIKFQTLTAAEIAAYLGSLEETAPIALTEEALLEPQRHKERIKDIYLELLKSLEAIGANDYEMWRAKAFLTGEENRPFVPAESQVSDWGEIAIFRAVQKLLFKCGCGDFCLADWIKPDRGRTIRHLSAVVGFARYQETQRPLFHERMTKRFDIDSEIRSNVETLETMLEEHRALRAEKEENEQAYDELAIEIQQLEARMKECREANSDARKESERMKKEKAKLQYEVDNAELSVQEKKDELHKWTSQVVQSPERKQQAIEQKMQLLQAIKSEVEELVRQRNAVKSSKQANQTLIQELRGLQFDVLIDLATESQQAVQRLRDDQAKLTACERDALQEASNVTGAEREYRRHEDHSAGEKKRWEMELAAAQEAHEAAMSELRRLEKEQREGVAVIELGEREVHRLHEQLKQELEQSKMEVGSMVRAYRVTERLWMERHANRMRALDANSSDDGEEQPCNRR